MKKPINSFDYIKPNAIFYRKTKNNNYGIEEIVFISESKPDAFNNFYGYFYVNGNPGKIFSYNISEFNFFCWEKESDLVKERIKELNDKMNFYKDRLEVLSMEDEKIQKIDKSYIAKKLGLEYPYEGLNLYVRNSGRTTDMLLEALVRLSEGESICIIVGHYHFGEDIFKKLKEYCKILNIDCENKIKVLENYRNQPKFLIKETVTYSNENIFIDHSFYE